MISVTNPSRAMVVFKMLSTRAAPTTSVTVRPFLLRRHSHARDVVVREDDGGSVGAGPAQ